MAGLADRRQAALDAITASQAEQLSILQETQRKELDAMKAARAACKALGVVESAIQRELEDERIAAQLKIDIRKAGETRRLSTPHTPARRHPPSGSWSAMN